MVFQLVATMLAVGLVLGFVGAGGSGFIISILITVFDYPIHTVLGTAILTMLLSSAAGAVSHYRERNMAPKTGAAAGAAGAVGAWFGSAVSIGIPGDALKWMTAAMLVLSGFALWLKMLLTARRKQAEGAERPTAGVKFWSAALGVGLATGALSGIFGIGSTPFIQIGLMAVLGLPPRLAAGTTMLVIIPIAFGGGLGFARSGHVDLQLLVEVAAGVMIGSYIGAKLTRRAPILFLKTAMVAVPMAGGAILFL